MMGDRYSELLIDRILSLCKKRGITIYQLSQMSGVSHSTLDNIVNRNTFNPFVALKRRTFATFADNKQ